MAIRTIQKQWLSLGLKLLWFCCVSVDIGDRGSCDGCCLRTIPIARLIDLVCGPIGFERFSTEANVRASAGGVGQEIREDMNEQAKFSTVDNPNLTWPAYRHPWVLAKTANPKA
ncbi:hypothetical protein L6452_08620 [Arctium lappa]|uniref:Uncharacterized protein n=1 Tax=Arctium lappa TaxID=4217 RepID=A0ACB9DI98_ARCLA|nr:hypothetical protein L6452_08620 [Arctium lappa]